MHRRDFIQSAVLIGGVLEFSVGESRPAKAATKHHLRYAPRLDFLSQELTIPQRLELFAENGFDACEYNGLMSHSLEEVAEIRNKMDSLGI